MIVESFEFYFHIRSLHDFIDFAVLLAADKFSVFVGELNLKSNLVVKGLKNKLEIQIV